MATHDSVKLKSKLFKVIFSSKMTLFSKLKYYFPSSFHPASVCGTSVASPGHPEPSEPPVSAGSLIVTSVCSAEMAAVHPVQDGPGGDSVI